MAPLDDRDRFVCASAGSHRVAFPIGAVQEVLSPRAITRLFHAPPSLLGVVNLRGEILPVVDLGHVLGAPPTRPTADANSEARLIVLRVPYAAKEGGPTRSTILSVHVSRLDALRDASEGGVSPLPAGVPDAAARVASGILPSPAPAALVVDPGKLVGIDELAALRMG